MRFAFAVPVFLAAVATITTAQTRDPSASPVAPVQITDIAIDVALDTERGLIEETATLTVSGRQVSTLQFRIGEGLSVETSKAGSGVVDHRKAGSRLLVSVDPPLNGTRRLTFTVTGRPRGSGGTRVGPDWAVLNPADHWYPTLPFTWASTQVRVRAPEGWTVIAPGQPTRDGTDGVWTWRTTNPVRDVAVAAGPDLELQEGKVVTTLLRVASSSKAHNVETLGGVLLDPMAWFSGTLAPYPFDSFNLVFIDGLRERVSAGGMLVVPRDTPVSSSPDGADLLAGQWFGELMAGDGRWIESFAAWETIAYSRDRSYPPPREIARLRSAYFDLARDDVPLSRADLKTPDEVVRGKGSAAPDAVRVFAGDRDFFKALGDLFGQPAGPPMSLDEVRAVFEQRVGRSLERPFSDWFDRVGAPDLEAKLRTHPSSTGGWRADISITQKGDPYALPVEIVLRGPGQTRRETVELSDGTTTVYYILPFEPTRMELDPLNRIYRRKAPSGEGR
jgi:aminopeptidase N